MVVTVSGEVQTNEKAQLYVHDLGLFVKVQLLEETPAVLSLGKLCEDHGYSCEWVSGQKPRFTKEGKTIFCITDNFVPLVVPGLSASSGSNSSETSTLQDLSSKSPAQGRSDQLASGNWSGSLQKTQNQTKKLMAIEARMTVCLIFLNGWRSFTDNLEDTEVPAPAYSSRDSDSERPTKVLSKSREHCVFAHFPKDRNCEVCLRTKMTRAPCRRRTG